MDCQEFSYLLFDHMALVIYWTKMLKKFRLFPLSAKCHKSFIFTYICTKAIQDTVTKKSDLK